MKGITMYKVALIIATALLGACTQQAKDEAIQTCTYDLAENVKECTLTKEEREELLGKTAIQNIRTIDGRPYRQNALGAYEPIPFEK